MKKLLLTTALFAGLMGAAEARDAARIHPAAYHLSQSGGTHMTDPVGHQSMVYYGARPGAYVGHAKVVHIHNGTAAFVNPSTARLESMVPGIGAEQYLAGGACGAGYCPLLLN